MTPEELESWVSEMRRLGITHLESNGDAITLGPPPQVVAPPQVDDTDGLEERIAHEKPGPDGLTPSEQADLYGTPFEKG